MGSSDHSPGVGLEYLYSMGRKPRDPRYCRTHAFVAQLFANTASNHENAQAWSYISQAWDELADIKQRTLDRPKDGRRRAD